MNLQTFLPLSHPPGIKIKDNSTTMGTEQYLVGKAGDKAFDPHSMHKLIMTDQRMEQWVYLS